MPDRAPAWDEARRIAADAVTRLPSREVSLPDAVEMTLATPALARCDLPGFDTAAMDGWAVSGEGPWHVVGEVLAGAEPTTPLAPGTAVTIATGAAVPDGGDAVVRREQGAVTEGALTASAAPATGADIRPRGGECVADEVLAPAGTVLGPALVGLLAAAGNDTLVVTRPPRVRLLLLGDELLDAGIPPRGSVRDSLGPQLPGWIERLGGTVIATERVPDTVPALVTVLTRSVRDADLVITTGGTAAGPVDCLHRAIAELRGQLLVDSVAVRPGHPMVLARVGAVPLLGLPGNPQSAIVGLATLGQPLLGALLGRPPVVLDKVVLTADLTAPPAEHRLVLGTVRQGRFTAVSHLGSAMLRGLAAAGGFAVVRPGGASDGDTVRWLPLPAI